MAGLVNHGVVEKGRQIRLRAWGVSICAHAILLSVLCLLQLSQPNAEAQQRAAVFSISQAALLAESPVIIPKPKVISTGGIIAKEDVESKIIKSEITKTRGINETSAANQAEPEVPKITEEILTPTKNETKPEQVQFFDNTSKGKRVCYVVDCSGSMQGLWQRVRRELLESISRLQQDQYFCVIAFGGGRVLESVEGKMEKATEQAKKKSYGFIESLRPAGGTNAPAALKHAVTISDDAGIRPSVVYFLTDGFELSEQDGSRFTHEVITMLRSFAPNTKINTIGFWPEKGDRKVLETIAKESGGDFVAIDGGGD